MKNKLFLLCSILFLCKISSQDINGVVSAKRSIKNDDVLHSVKSESLVHSISTLENIKILPPTPEERKIIDSLKSEAVASLEKCKKTSGNCIDDIELFGPSNAGFKGGINNFRKILFEKFKIHANTQKGENKLRITIGKQNNIEKIDFIRYTDDVSKKEIVSLFQSKELNNWHSAKVYKYPVQQEFEISIFIEDKR
ncbi:hypothetical protein DBR39_03635 [Chryseobacterium sp. KBW03]|uniref:hypothetical protein n=1 Tax=Chryseobacterium sp. KBW03 TaxID=2153362 RepID=UPI000F5A9B36|nr:hypothetical protein [Chryseobacterium sp. KBW03]RQO41716.1 hypothetical protein DBR39_03635 [Chryseobacterium sp. KBW03]